MRRSGCSKIYFVLLIIGALYLLYSYLFFSDNGDFSLIETQENYNKYANDRLGMSVSVPNGWAVRNDMLESMSDDSHFVALVTGEGDKGGNKGALVISRYPLLVGENQIIHKVSEAYVDSITSEAYGDYFNIDISNRYEAFVGGMKATAVDIHIYVDPDRADEIVTQYLQSLDQRTRVYVFRHDVATYAIQSVSMDSGTNAIFEFVIGSIKFNAR